MGARFDIRVLDPYGPASRRVPPWVISLGPPSVRSAFALVREVRNWGPDIIHVHVSAMRRFALGGLLLMKASRQGVIRILTIHGGNFVGDFQAGPLWSQALMRRVTREFDGVIAVNDDIAETVREIGLPDSRLAVIPAFLPPQKPPAEQSVAEWRSAAGSGSAVLVTSGYGCREYGFGVIIEALASDRSLAERCVLVICTYGDRDERYMADVERASHALPFVRHLRDLSPEEFAAVLAGGDMYIRATTLDGDAVAVREAGAFSKQIIASDAVRRPAGCLLFKTGQASDLANAIRQAMADRSLGLIGDESRDGVRRILDFYERVKKVS